VYEAKGSVGAQSVQNEMLLALEHSGGHWDARLATPGLCAYVAHRPAGLCKGKESSFELCF
jgi:hypothetical protein